MTSWVNQNPKAQIQRHVNPKSEESLTRSITTNHFCLGHHVHKFRSHLKFYWIQHLKVNKVQIWTRPMLLSENGHKCGFCLCDVCPSFLYFLRKITSGEFRGGNKNILFTKCCWEILEHPPSMCDNLEVHNKELGWISMPINSFAADLIKQIASAGC